MSNKFNKTWVGVIDFGSQYTQLISRRVRELNFYSIILPFNITLKDLTNCKALILSGGPGSVYEKNFPKLKDEIIHSSIPILGICYGMQYLLDYFNGEVREGKCGEYGKVPIRILKKDILFYGLPEEFYVWMSHKDSIFALPDNFEVLASSKFSNLAACKDKSGRFYCLQFHPEVSHTEFGLQILENFLYRICKMEPNWFLSSFINEKIAQIKEEVQNKKVICAVSGGIDSTTCCVLFHRAIKDNLYAFFVDNGLIAAQQVDFIKKIFKRMDFKLHIINKKSKFLSRLKGVVSPEKKRKIIGREFANIFKEVAKKVGAEFLAQGTLYPDVIESGIGKSKSSAKIKTHHNVGGMPKNFNLKIIEPFRELFKDEVRKIAKELNLPEELINMHPLPGPGLAVRIIGPVTKLKLKILAEADQIIIEELKKHNLYEELWQMFSVFLPIKTTGVMGDRRAYKNVLAIRAVVSQDGMTADWAKLPYELLSNIANRIVNQIKYINRVVYDITTKPPATIEWE